MCLVLLVVLEELFMQEWRNDCPAVSSRTWVNSACSGLGAWPGQALDLSPS